MPRGWTLGRVVRFDIEDPWWITLFLALTLGAPVVTAVWLVSVPRQDRPARCEPPAVR
jgi:hypothetical protein